jgi:DNA polymerase I-like protein with 3'-5' exonuclease and polymerase domains
MLDGFRNGYDAHDSTTRLIWNIEKDHPEWSRRRSVDKRLGFGVIYGAGIRTLADQIKLFTGEDLGEQGVRTLWDQYRDAFPELFRYSREAKRLVERRGYLVLPGGKVRKFYPEEPTHKAFNAMIQGSVAVGMTEAMLEIELQVPGVMVGQVHDSVIFESESQFTVGIVGSIISHVFEELFPGCPFPTEVKRYDSK